MKKIIYGTFAILALAAVGCEKIDSLLDTENYEKYDTSTFPTTEKDANQIITGIYNTLPARYDDAKETNLYRNCVASDEMFGGANNGGMATDHFLEDGSEKSQTNWKWSYKQIFRANYALEAIPEMDDAVFSSPDAKNYMIGQAYFLRAWANWELAEKFETFPVLTSTTPVNIPRSSVDEVYESITSDLLNAIELMPAKYRYSTESGYSGRATKYAAEAALGRIWLFYTGFYGKSEMFGVTKSDIISYLKDVRDNSGFGLEKDPREIWPWTNEYSSGFAYGTDFNTLASRNNLHWVGNRSKETVWGCHFSMVFYQNPTKDARAHNRVGEYMAMTNANKAAIVEGYPFGRGYGNATVNSNFVKDWLLDPDYGPSDIRLWGSVVAVDNAAEAIPWMEGQFVELPDFLGDDTSEREKTMFHNKKYTVIACYRDASAQKLYENFFYAYDGFVGKNSNKYDQRDDAIYIRYADVLLMLDELEQTVTGMNQLRQRAGLQPYSAYSLERLQKERRYELCFEGVRFSDLRRWYPETAGKIISDNQTGAFMEDRGKVIPNGWTNIPGNTLEQRYAKTRGFWMLSNTEITLSNDVLTQTPGFEDGDNWMFSISDLPY